jgi:protein-S-isoprenylcysteine O-methyltransferase Ste14
VNRVRRPDRLFPPALFLLGTAGIGYALIREVSAGGTDHRLRALTILVYLAWLLAEARITFGASTGESGGRDRGTVYAYGLARVVTAGAALLPAHAGWGWPQSAGLVVLVAGAGFRLVAVHQLGRFYSHRVRTLTDHAVVRDGVYAWVRHPAYLGMTVAHAGLVAVFPSLLAAAALVLLLVPAVGLRIRVEEQTLMALPGYPEYAAQRPRLIPALW